MSQTKLTIRNIRYRAVEVPMNRPLPTRIVVLETIPLLLIDLETEEGVTGHAYLFAYLRSQLGLMGQLLDEIAAFTKGEAVAPTELFDRLFKRLSLHGHQGLATLAISGFDVACWDALSKAAGMPLAQMLGGTVRPVRAYNSNGLGIMEPKAAADEAVELLEGGFKAMKIRLGRETLDADLRAIAAVRSAIPDDIDLMSDFNQGLTTMEAIRRGHALDDEGLIWIEEPIVYDDLAGCAKIAAEVATPISIGENFYGPLAMAEAITAEAADYMMPDLQRIGGVTGWLRAAALAHGARIEMSSHLFPEVSAQLMTVTPTAHWLEYVDWAAPILAEPLKIADGHAVIPDAAGNGLAWNEDGVAKYAVDV
ncbi:MAG: mandelate racemase [Rhodospirillaceae bacterium]|nr:mandelate racemase [Rhodospirillaceae bacterium]